MTTATEPMIDVDDLTKRFTLRRRGGGLLREKTVVSAVDGLSLRVEPGELVGFIGPNGAGKSTTVKVLTGILTPSSGRVRVAGLDPSRERVALARRIGVVFGQRTTLWWDLPLEDSFALLRHVYRVDADRHRANLERLVELLDLGPFLRTPVRQLSLGQRMRGDLTAALLHDPEVLYLDEPTIGLDLTSKATVRSFLAELNRESGTTVVLTTHDLDDVEQLCRRIVVIDNGHLISDGTLDETKARFGGERTLVVDLTAPAPPLDVPGATVTKVEGVRQWLSFDPSLTTAAALVAAVAAQHDLADLTVREPDIEDVVARIYASA